MTLITSLFFLTVSFSASVVGAICGIGGGVIIKPTLDLFGLASVSTISFLSGCTVLSMSCYSVGKNLISGESRVSIKTGTPLALGAVVGGVLGKQLFSIIKAMFSNADAVGAVQSACLAAITMVTMLYAIFKSRIKTCQIKSIPLCIAIGLALGILSSFLGIGGGPVNLVLLYFFFSMDTKTAAENSLYIILFSQIASLITTLVTRSVPDFNWKIDNAAVDRLFVLLMAVIIGISLFNTWRYSTG